MLDYGCGPGSYSIVAARMAGSSGKVYAFDIHPLAVGHVMKRTAQERLSNIRTMLSDRDTGLPDNSMDIVLLYDIFCDLGDPVPVLAERRRVLKTDGVLFFSDHHMKTEDIIARMTGSGLFRLSTKGKKTYRFVKAGWIFTWRWSSRRARDDRKFETPILWLAGSQDAIQYEPIHRASAADYGAD